MLHAVQRNLSLPGVKDAALDVDAALVPVLLVEAGPDERLQEAAVEP